MGPKCSDRCPFKRHTGERGKTGKGHVTLEAAVTVMWPQTKEYLEPQKLEGVRGVPLEPWEGAWPSTR